MGSLEKGFRILQAFRDGESSLSLSEIARKTGFGKSAAQRFCHTLAALGYLVKDERSRRLRPSPRVLEFSYAYLHGDPLVSAASPMLLRAHEICGEAVNLALPLDTHVIYVVRLPSLGAALTSPLVGGMAPMFCTASGRAYLSTLAQDEVESLIDRSDRTPLTLKTITDRQTILDRIAEARELGFTLAEEECIVGELTVASPLRGRDRRGVGSINICVTRPAWTIDQVRIRLAPIVSRTALEISRALGLSPSA